MKTDLIMIKEKPIIPEKWDYDNSVIKFENLFRKVREEGEKALTEFYIAYTILTEDSKKKVGRKYPNNNFEGYCEDIGIDKKTGYNWLHKYFKLPLRIVEISTIPLAPEGKYDVIIIDPPWPYGTEYNEETRRVASPYPEMDLEQIKNINLPTFDNCVLWLWTTHKFIKDAFDILEGWGFEYKLTLAWDKQKLGMGSWLRCQTEFCLLGIKGKPEWNLTNERDFISEAGREHSRKPDKFYEMVKKLTKGRRIDYFSREKREGFKPYGNETNKFQPEE